MKMLLLSLAVVFSANSARAGDAHDCEARLVGDWVYGAVKTMLDAQRIQPQHIEKMLASSVPINPVSHLTNLESSPARTLLAEISRDPKVEKHWTATQARLRRLLDSHEANETIGKNAEEATRPVLAPTELLKFKSFSGSVSPMTLPDGRHVIAHFAGTSHLAITDLATKTEIMNRPLPESVQRGHTGLLNWFRDNQGKLWIYLAVVKADEWTRVYKFEWDNGTFEEVKLQLTATTKDELLSLFSPGPGIQILQTGSGYFDISSGQRNLIQEYVGNRHGDYVYGKNGNGVFPNDHSFSVSKVYPTASGPAFVKAKYGEIKIEWPDGTEELIAPQDDWIPKTAAFIEMEPGREFLAIEYQKFRPERRAIFFWNLEASAGWTHKVDVGGTFLTSMHWIKQSNGVPILGMAENSGQSNRAIFADPYSSLQVLNQELPGFLNHWFEIGGSAYFSTSNRNKEIAVFKVFSERGTR